MDWGLSTKSRPLRAILLGPAFPSDIVGGLQLALRDVVNQLNQCGWQVDEQIWVTPNREGQSETRKVSWQNTFLPSSLSPFQRWPLLLAIWMNIVPPPMRQVFSTLLMRRAYFDSVSDNLYAAEKLIEDAQKYDLALLCVNGAPPGMSALIAEKLEQVVFISLSGVAIELSSGWRWAWGRRVAYWHLRGQSHPYLFRPVSPTKIPPTIFASTQWQKDAIRAGLPASRANTIYFGVPASELPPRSAQISNRLLWVGRLSLEKGLHLLLRAMPAIRQKIANVTLSIVAGQGPDGYRQLIMATIKKYHLEEVVTFLLPVERIALQTVYATHDVLFFHSIFAEPVALVLMEAFAAGLPVVSSQACADAKLVQDQVTCLCYQPNSLASVVRTVVTMLTDANIRQRVTENARQLIQQEFSLDKMGQAYDELLRRLAG